MELSIAPANPRPLVMVYSQVHSCVKIIPRRNKTFRSKLEKEHGRGEDYQGKEREKRYRFYGVKENDLGDRDMDRRFKIDETDEWVIFVIFAMASSLTGA